MNKRDEKYKSRLQVKREILRNLTMEQLLAAVGGMMVAEDIKGRCTVTIPPSK